MVIVSEYLLENAERIPPKNGVIDFTPVPEALVNGLKFV